MALLNQATQVSSQLEKLFQILREGQAPTNFSREFLKDIGFKSSNHHAFIPLLKGLGFLSSDGSPTQRYRDFLDGTKWKKILAEAVREAYSDIFVLKAKPTKADKKMIIGKYKSTYNMSEVVADRAASTFLALIELCDEDVLYGSASNAPPPFTNAPPAEELPPTTSPPPLAHKPPVGLHYNLQIHLPATKDVEVYNAIFRSLREHLID